MGNGLVVDGWVLGGWWNSGQLVNGGGLVGSCLMVVDRCNLQWDVMRMNDQSVEWLVEQFKVEIVVG